MEKPTQEPQRKELKCARCGGYPEQISQMLEPQSGKTIRLYRCDCGERIWDD